ncbi:DNA-binding protein [Blautia liquoris]|jgi:hypothetical protein|uniref:UPF0122 protein INP51_05840 n=1 Tax=Blautia liquoris TaxID=2779518 RepID=A0A7M2RJG0_9FIRM|nr:DNA-binding protein [Blautia liquoris]QOV20466.1 DNA-binding protein [Blautia liquoris]
MNKLIEQALLYDFYGELLTKHQRQVYEEVVLNDYSISEVAQASGISRQGVSDMVRRCNKILEGYEDKLHLVEKFVHIKEHVNQIRELTHSGAQTEVMRQIEEISTDILEEL